MATKVIKNKDTDLYLAVSSGSGEALRQLTEQSDSVTAVATSVLSKVDVEMIESFLTSEHIKIN